MTGSPRLRLHLTPAAETAVRRGHPWVYADRIRQQNRAGSAGEIAALYDRKDRFLALGLYDPESTLRVRVLHAGSPVAIDDAWWAARLKSALERRLPHFDEQTTGWRCIHGESDGWPGLVMDRYGQTFVVKFYTSAWFPWIETLRPIFEAALRPRAMVARLSRNIATNARDVFGISDGDALLGDAPREPILFLESGLRFEADVVRGQKTGFFLDQRENRRRVGEFSSGADVLNAFSFSGGFSVYAARGGARSVTDLDISPHALASARRNFAHNESISAVRAARHELIQADAFEWLRECEDRKFDRVVLDPPSLARRESERAGAMAAYAQLARLGVARLRGGGVLFAGSCSAHVPADDFFSTVREAVRREGRRFEEIETTRHPFDHPAGFPEAHYLKGIYLKVF